ncbi:hypothetical protein B5S33_g5310 [[Candida] boidinii]|nr:hypothetical protein B5S33_g5310 [[Candida] boidinii]
MSQQYTCNSCGLAFPTAEDQRYHMKTEWHRYNLKRKVANLPAISEDLFNSKVANLTSSTDDIDTKDEEDEKTNNEKKKNKTITKKEIRRRQKEELAEKKRQLLELAKQKMLASGGVIKINDDGKIKFEQNIDDQEGKEVEITEVLENVKIEEDEIKAKLENEDTEVDQTELTEEELIQQKLANRVEISPLSCLFCTKRFPFQGKAIEHMFKVHGMYIPERNYLVDEPGLIKYLSEKIGLGNACLSCNYMGRNLEAVRAHMLSKSHCRIPYESEDEKLEISDFYDFTSSYSTPATTTSAEDGEEEEWEDVDEEDVDEDDDNVTIASEDLPQEISYVNGHELHLPTGQVVGHRSLARYYRQNVKPEKELSEGHGTVIAAETRHFATTIDREQSAESKRVWRKQEKSKDRNDRRAAKFINNQEHYRDQLLQ